MPQLQAYHRPTTLAQALTLLARPHVETRIIAGGSSAVAELDNQIDEVVDLQGLGLTEIQEGEVHLTLGAMTLLQTLVDDMRVPKGVREAAYRAGPNTLRNRATMGGVIVQGSPGSELLAALLVHDATVEVQAKTGMTTLELEEFLADIPTALGRGLVTAISFFTAGQTASARVARTPADSPIVAAIARITAEGQIKLALCGVAATPILVDPGNVGALDPSGDFRGSAAYRKQMAATLARRVLDEISG